jgi:DNA/RNA endonuclease G (NUC1)
MLKKQFLYFFFTLLFCLFNNSHITAAPQITNTSTTSTSSENVLKYGKPCTECTILSYTQFVLCHDNAKKVPLWSVYESRPEDLQTCDKRPKVLFIPEPSLSAGERAELSDYKAVKTCREAKSGPCPKPLKAKYDIGHMTPSNAMCATDIMKKTFVLSNAVPQFWKFNETPWNQLEQKIDKFAKTHTIWVSTGPVFRNGKPLEKVGKDQVWAPTDCYKIVIYEVSGHPHAFAFVGANVMPTKKTDLNTYVTTMSFCQMLFMGQSNASS